MVNASATAEVLLKAGADVNAKDNKGALRRCTMRRWRMLLRPLRSWVVTVPDAEPSTYSTALNSTSATSPCVDSAVISSRILSQSGLSVIYLEFPEFEPRAANTPPIGLWPFVKLSIYSLPVQALPIFNISVQEAHVAVLVYVSLADKPIPFLW